MHLACPLVCSLVWLKLCFAVLWSMIHLNALCYKQKCSVFQMMTKFSGFKCLLWESGGKQWIVKASNCVRIGLNYWWPFPINVSAVSGLCWETEPFWQANIPLETLCKFKSWVWVVRNWYYRFYAVCAAFLLWVWIDLLLVALFFCFKKKSEVFLDIAAFCTPWRNVFSWLSLSSLSLHSASPVPAWRCWCGLYDQDLRRA